MAMWKGGFISNLRIRQIFFFIFCKNGWQEKLLLRYSDLYQLVFSGNPFFSDSFDYVSILLTPPTHYVSKRKHLTSPTHPLFPLRNIWMVPKEMDRAFKSIQHIFMMRQKMVKLPTVSYLQKKRWPLRPKGPPQGPHPELDQQRSSILRMEAEVGSDLGFA